MLMWYLTRAAGWTAYALLTGSMILGIGLGGRWRSRRWPRFALNDLHRYLSLVTLVFIGIHAATLAFDSYISFSLADLLVPGLSSYRTLWTALGIVAAWLALAAWLSDLVRKRIGQRWWRRLHWATYAVYVLATLHGIKAGSDSGSVAAIAAYAASVGAVAGLTVWRGMTETTKPAGARSAAARPRPAPVAAQVPGAETALRGTLHAEAEVLVLDATTEEGVLRLELRGRPAAGPERAAVNRMDLVLQGWNARGRVTSTGDGLLRGIVEAPGSPPVAVTVRLDRAASGPVTGTAWLAPVAVPVSV
jgi:DMSO/TMAO reductase YedYZ heme-binding membrane subunit